MKPNNKIIFGSMRMLEYSYDECYWVDLFDYMYEKGIEIHHVSSEYASFDFYLRILKLFKEKFPFKVIKHLVKLAEPHFDSDTFNAELFYIKIINYLNNLDTKKIWGVQWMWRGDMKFEEKRIEDYIRNFNLLLETVRNCKKNEQFEGFYLFPYTDLFCSLSQKLNSDLSTHLFDGLTVYRNYNEREYDDFLNLFPNNIIIRPLNAGKLDENISKKDALDFSINHPNIDYGIVSISSKEKLNELIYGL
jgi:hypothetical protein